VDYLRTLNHEQHAAVTAPIAPILVKAGAGSGKTRVLTLRIAHLVAHHHVDPQHILALTFTNKAAKEMRSRLKPLLGHALKRLTTGTFHAICVHILRQHVEGRIGHYTRNFSIYSGDEQFDLVQRSIDAAPESSPEPIDVDDVLRRISRAKSRLQTPRMLLAQSHKPQDQWVALRYRHYQGLLDDANAVDFDDLILLTHRLLSEHEDVLDAIQQQWRHILVDEYQDTDPSQFSLVRMLSEPVGSRPQSLFAVGDAMQSIYGFRNADHTIISRFAETFPQAHVIELKTNYRSRQPILDAAYAVIRRSQVVTPMQLNAHHRHQNGEQSIVFLEYQSGKEEADKIAYEISQMTRSDDDGGGMLQGMAVAGRRPRDIAILYRSKHLSRQYEEALRRYRVPYKLKGQLGFYDRAVIRDMLAYLRLAVNPRDNMALNRIADVPKRGLSAKPLKVFSVEAARRNLAIADVLSDIMILAQLDEPARQGARKLQHILARMRQRIKNHTPARVLIEDILQETGYQSYLEQLHSKDPEKLSDAKAHLEELLVVADEHDNVEEFLQYVAIMTSSDDGDDERDQVQLLTIHASKGLEWPAVFVTGLEEGILPHERSMVSDDGIEEERRLCYVAVTRAAERLYLSWCHQRSGSGNRQRKSNVKSTAAAKRSRFYDDIEAYGRELAKQSPRRS
jgi:DNA helicase-2/ATP-dependent DNA helicase PcrA